MFSISAFIFTQCTDSCASNLVLSICMWLLCSCLNIYICNWDGVITHLPFMASACIVAISCLMGQYLCMSCVTSSYLCGYPCMIYAFSSCSCASHAIASCIFCIDVHKGRSTVVSFTLTFMLRPCISLSLFFLWLCCDRQSMMNSLGLACIVSIPCTGVCIELWAAGIVIMLPHLCQL